MTVHFLDPTNLECAFLLDVQTISQDVLPSIIARVHKVRDSTRKHPATPSTILNLYRLSQLHSPVNHLLDTHINKERDC
jgi:hypothetical protein